MCKPFLRQNNQIFRWQYSPSSAPLRITTNCTLQQATGSLPDRGPCCVETRGWPQMQHSLLSAFMNIFVLLSGFLNDVITRWTGPDNNNINAPSVNLIAVYHYCLLVARSSVLQDPDVHLRYCIPSAAFADLRSSSNTTWMCDCVSHGWTEECLAWRHVTVSAYGGVFPVCSSVAPILRSKR